MIESSGGYENFLLKELSMQGHKTWQVDPKRIKAFITSEGIKAKSDKIDARMIALFGTQKQRSYSKEVKTHQDDRLQALNKRRSDLIKIIVKEKNRAKHPAQIHCAYLLYEHITFMEGQIKAIEKEGVD
jgi:transposase